MLHHYRFTHKDSGRTNYLGVILGVLIAVMSYGGIVLIRKVCVAAFIFVLCLFSISFFLFKSDFAFDGFHFSLLGTASVVLVSLSGLINLPTFFRHSRSKADSVFALTLITVFISLFQFLGISSGFFATFNGVGNFFECGTSCVLFAVSYVLVTAVCVNLGNVYFASAVLEFFFPNARKSIGYILIGLCGSLFYALFGSSDLFVFTENIVEGFIVNLSVVLLMAFICKIVMHYKPRLVEKWADNICWFLGCIASFYVANHSTSGYYESISAGVVTSILCFVVFLFIGKTVEAIKNL